MTTATSADQLDDIGRRLAVIGGKVTQGAYDSAEHAAPGELVVEQVEVARWALAELVDLLGCLGVPTEP